VDASLCALTLDRIPGPRADPGDPHGSPRISHGRAKIRDRAEPFPLYNPPDVDIPEGSTVYCRLNIIEGRWEVAAIATIPR
jgi:hypothetical protein